MSLSGALTLSATSMLLVRLETQRARLLERSTTATAAMCYPLLWSRMAVSPPKATEPWSTWPLMQQPLCETVGLCHGYSLLGELL